MGQETTYHIPALLQPCIDGLDIKSDGTYVDVTFGGGGHSRAILSHLGPNGRLIAMDQDADAVANAIDDPRFTLARGNFKFLSHFLEYMEVEKIDGLIADLGVSFHHFDAQDRGFSFRFDAPLDMRMNTTAALNAKSVVNNYSEEELANVLYLYGEMHNSRKIANAIAQQRAKKAIETTTELASIVEPLLKGDRQKKELTKVFQALRIEVNKEMDALKQLLQHSATHIRQGGRLVVLTYHSLEDRIVKNYVKTGDFAGKATKDFYGNISAPFRAVNNKVITPEQDEIERNPRSRRAKLRIAERTQHG